MEHAMGPDAYTRKERMAVKERLASLIKRDFGSRYAFEQALELNHSTAAGWFGKTVKIPGPAMLRRLAKKCGWSEAYILRGEGPEHLEQDRPLGDLAESMRQHLRHRLARGAPPDKAPFLDAWLACGEGLLEEIVASFEARADEAWRAWRAGSRMRLGQALRERASAHPPRSRMRRTMEAYYAMLAKASLEGRGPLAIEQLSEALMRQEPQTLPAKPHSGAIGIGGPRPREATNVLGPGAALTPEEFRAWQADGSPSDWGEWRASRQMWRASHP
jgi:hypothetical protein